MTHTLDDYLSIAREFIEHMVPVFISPPLPPRAGGEFLYPKEWQLTVPGNENLASLRDYKLGWAISAVTGYMFDVIDVDPRNGGDRSFDLLMQAGCLPQHRWLVTTPSGGLHYYINRTGLRSLGAGRLLPGIDFKAGDFNGNGRGFVYLPGTFRSQKARDGKIPGYVPQGQMDWEALDKSDDSEEFRRFMELVITRLGENWNDKPVKGNGYYTGPALTNEQHKRVAESLAGAVSALSTATQGERNDALNKVGYFVGGLISGSGLEEELAYYALAQTARKLGLEDKEIEYHLSRSIAQGRLRPVEIFSSGNSRENDRDSRDSTG